LVLYDVTTLYCETDTEGHAELTDDAPWTHVGVRVEPGRKHQQVEFVQSTVCRHDAPNRNRRVFGPTVLGELRYFGASGRVALPTGVACFPKEIMLPPRRWCETGYNITHWTTLPRGGRFAAFEQPELFVEDVNAFFEKVR